jgi:hypothetical protein
MNRNSVIPAMSQKIFSMELGVETVYRMVDEKRWR